MPFRRKRAGKNMSAADRLDVLENAGIAMPRLAPARVGGDCPRMSRQGAQSAGLTPGHEIAPRLFALSRAHLSLAICKTRESKLNPAPNAWKGRQSLQTSFTSLHLQEFWCACVAQTVGSNYRSMAAALAIASGPSILASNETGGAGGLDAGHQRGHRHRRRGRSGLAGGDRR